MIGGPQGSGINSVAENFAKGCMRGGLHVFANIEYHSNIKGELSKYQVMVNTIALGASLGLVDYNFDLAAAAIREGFTGRKAALGDMNVSAAKHGYDYAQKTFGPDALSVKLRTQRLSGQRMMIRGVQAVGI